MYSVLEAIEFVIAEIPLEDIDEPVVIALENFVLSAVAVEPSNFDGITISNTGNDTNNLIYGNTSFESFTAAITLPSTLFDNLRSINNTDANNTTIANARITSGLYLNDILFLSRNSSSFLEVRSSIISAKVVGQTITGLPINHSISIEFFVNVRLYEHQ